MTQGTGRMRAQTVEPSVLDANHAEMQRVLATAMELHQQGKLEHAEQLYRVLIGLDPNHADALHLLGLIANQAGNYESAVELIERAIGIKPDVPQYCFNLGATLQNLERNAEAARAYARALELKPDYREALENMGVALQNLGDLDGAMDAYSRAVSICPASTIAQSNLGTLRLARGQTHKAEQHFRHALSANPSLADVRLKLASTRLLQGDYGAGWDAYEWRYCSPSFVELNPPAFAPFPKWQGGSLRDKTILITPEQGVGDEVLFSSCYQDVINSAQHCIIRSDARLVDIMRRSFPDASIEATNAPQTNAHIDCRIPAGSLPRFFRRDIDAFPTRSQYLWADPHRGQDWREWLDRRDDTLKVGISWRGGLKANAREARSIKLAAWREIVKTDGASFFSLQYGDHGDEISTFNSATGGNVCEPEGLDPMHGLDDLVAFISALDLVITIDNSTTHFAAAVGVPTWVLLPVKPEWRWREDDGENPWFGSLSTFRQANEDAGDWQPLLTRVGARLRSHIAQFEPRTPVPPPVCVADSTKHVGIVDIQQHALLINDTTDWYHFGCTATSLAIHDRLRANGCSVSAISIRQIVDLNMLPASLEDFDSDRLFAGFSDAHPELVAKMESADTIYVNGEGTLHRLSHQASALLYLIRIATNRLGKRVRMINHSCYPEGDAATPPGVASQLYAQIFSQLEHIAVREGQSAALLRDLGLDVCDSFDSLPLYIEHLYERSPIEASPYVVIAGGVTWQPHSIAAFRTLAEHMDSRGIGVKLLTGANAYPAGDDARFVEALWNAGPGGVELVHATSESEWLDLIASARLLVSGRFHHSIAAAFLGTPFIVSQSNTPKISALTDMLDLDALLPTPLAWSDDAARDYQCRLLDKAAFFLDQPEACRLDDERREALLAAARRNFAEPASTA